MRLTFGKIQINWSRFNPHGFWAKVDYATFNRLILKMETWNDGKHTNFLIAEAPDPQQHCESHEIIVISVLMWSCLLILQAVYTNLFYLWIY